MAGSGIKIVGQNKKARHLYEFLDIYEAGIVLTGSEVKSLRAGRISFMDGHVRLRNGEAYLVGVHIAPYENAGYSQHDPDRERKLLLNKSEIKTLTGKVEQKGLTVIPVKVYLRAGRFKIELALARGKTNYDRRQTLKERAVARDMAREMH